MTNLIAAIIAALIAVESEGKVNAVGDRGLAVGILQIHPVAVLEANRAEAIRARKEGRTPRHWKLADRWDGYQSRQMAWTLLERWYRLGVTDPVALACKWQSPRGRKTWEYRRKIVARIGNDRALVARQ